MSTRCLARRPVMSFPPPPAPPPLSDNASTYHDPFDDQQHQQPPQQHQPPFPQMQRHQLSDTYAASSTTLALGGNLAYAASDLSLASKGGADPYADERDREHYDDESIPLTGQGQSMYPPTGYVPSKRRHQKRKLMLNQLNIIASTQVRMACHIRQPPKNTLLGNDGRLSSAV